MTGTQARYLKRTDKDKHKGLPDVISLSTCASRVHEFTRGVVEYHRACNFQQTSLITLTLQMAAFALPDLSVEEVGACIRQLADNGIITILSENPLSFTPKM